MWYSLSHNVFSLLMGYSSAQNLSLPGFLKGNHCSSASRKWKSTAEIECLGIWQVLVIISYFSSLKVFLLKKTKIMGCHSFDMSLYMMNLKQSKCYETEKLINLKIDGLEDCDKIWTTLITWATSGTNYIILSIWYIFFADFLYKVVR